MATLYQELQVPRDASTVDIEAAFRERLADLQALPHPDPGALANLREAYHVLANPARRMDYDETLPRIRTDAASTAATDAPRWHEGRGKWIAIAGVIIVVAWWGLSRKSGPTSLSGKSSSVTATSTSKASVDADTSDPVKAAVRTASGPDALLLSKAPPTFTGSAEEVFSGASGSIASIRALDSSGSATAFGSGVVIGEGFVLTTCQVTSGAHSIRVKVGGEELPASVASKNEARDLCKLSVSGLSAPVPPFASVTSLRVGQRVYSVGAPQGQELVLAEGLVASLREVPGGTLIQTTVPISPGSSGGGLFDAGGRLVGIVTLQAALGEAHHFALPADWAFEIARE